MISRILLASILALAPSLALATPLTLQGDYDWQTYARQDGRPVCQETWTFAGTGLTVRSGQEVARKRYRIEEGGGLQVLVMEVLETNGAPDCMGQRASAPAPGERRVLILPMNDGSILTCPPPPQDGKGQGQFVVGDCYGTLRAVH